MAYTETDIISYGNDLNWYQVGAMIDLYHEGNKDADQQAINACIVRAMIKGLEFYNIHGSDSGLTSDDVYNMRNTIYEYDDAQFINVSDYIISESEELVGGLGSAGLAGSYVTGTLPEPRSYVFTVASDGQTIFTMPFDIEDVYDVDEVDLTLNAAIDCIYGTDYTMVSNILTWNSYDLSAGWVFEIKYWL